MVHGQFTLIPSLFQYISFNHGLKDASRPWSILILSSPTPVMPLHLVPVPTFSCSPVLPACAGVGWLRSFRRESSQHTRRGPHGRPARGEAKRPGALNGRPSALSHVKSRFNLLYFRSHSFAAFHTLVRGPSVTLGGLINALNIKISLPGIRGKKALTCDFLAATPHTHTNTLPVAKTSLFHLIRQLFIGFRLPMLVFSAA